MPDEPAYIRNFKAYTRIDPTPADLPALEDQMYGSNDRSMAVMLSAVVETCLEIFLRNKTRPSLNSDDTRLLFDYRGPLGDFSSKIFIAFAFNMFGPDTRHDLDLIRMMRNEFAHSRKPVDFFTKEVANVCKHLRAADWAGANIPAGYLAAMRQEELPSARKLTNPRTRYATSCHTIAERLLVNAYNAPPSAGYIPDLL
jgi:hypothetical protein